MSSIILISRPGCSACSKLERYLLAHDIGFQKVDGSTAEGKTWMLTEGVFLSYFPALLVDGRLYEYAALFAEDGQVLDLMEGILA